MSSMGTACHIWRSSTEAQCEVISFNSRERLGGRMSTHANPPEPKRTTRHKWESQCKGKRQCATFDIAHAHMMGMYKRGLEKMGRLKVYECAFCPYWHVGHPRKKVKV